MKLKTAIAIATLCCSPLCNIQAQGITDLLNKAKSAISAITGVSTGSITGTWVYESTNVNFTSDNLLAKAGGELLSSKAEEQINSILNKYGLTPSKLTITFASDSTYTCSFKGDSTKVTSGTYSFSDGKLVLTPTLMKKEITLSAKVSSELEINFNANKLLTLLQGISSLKTENSTIATVGKLLENYSGLQIGLKFKKK